MGDLQQIKILIVDDEEPMRKHMSKVLCKAGMDVLTAPSGEEALKVLRENSCDIVISDVRMAGMSGFDLLNQVKALHPNTAFVVMTGYADSFSIKDALLHGADEYIAKPFKNDEMALVIERAYWRIQADRKQTEIA